MKKDENQEDMKIIILRNLTKVLRRKLEINREALKRDQILITKLKNENARLKKKLKEKEGGKNELCNN